MESSYYIDRTTKRGILEMIYESAGKTCRTKGLFDMELILLIEGRKVSVKRTHFDRAICELYINQFKDYTAAEEYLNYVMESEPRGNQILLYNLAKAHFDIRNYTKASEFMQRYLHFKGTN